MEESDRPLENIAAENHESTETAEMDIPKASGLRARTHARL
jgi:hypothetical protein